jgi:hypothetical protein
MLSSTPAVHLSRKFTKKLSDPLDVVVGELTFYVVQFSGAGSVQLSTQL